MSRTPAPIRVGIEITPKKVFASALDWPGWSRAGRTEEAALEALEAYGTRFLPFALAAGVGSPLRGPIDVVQRLPGDATTAFGAPSIVFDADREPVTEADGIRLAALLEAAWAALHEVAAHAPAELRKGPRGGGRDRDRVLEHVEEAHGGYRGPMGVRLPPPLTADRNRAIRGAMLEILRVPSDGTPPPGARWPQRYAARRVAWHALDHAWEIEDRSAP
jgi:hypothetical protein